VTPLEVLGKVSDQGYHLALRPGGLRLTGCGEPLPDLLALIAAHRPGLLALLESETPARAAHEASLLAGRITTFPESLAHYLHPALVRACADSVRVR